MSDKDNTIELVKVLGTVPVTGTINVSGVATSANQTNGTQTTRITDGSLTNTLKLISTQVTGSDSALVTNTVIHGLTTAGGGSYVDVKVNPSGALTVASTQDGTWTTGRTWTLASGTDSVTTVPSGTQTVSGTVAATQSGAWSTGRTWALSSGADSITTVPSGTQTVSGTVAVSGSVAVTGPLTDTQLRATAVPVSGTFWQTTQPVSLATNTPTIQTGSNIIGRVGIDQTTPGTTNKVSIGTDGTVAATQSGTWNIGSITTLPSLPAGNNNVGDVDVASIVGTGSIANGQVTVTSSSAQVVAARSGRRSLVIVNHGTTDVYLGTGTVTTANGLYLKGTSGASVSIPTSAAVNGIVASGTQVISYMEVF